MKITRYSKVALKTLRRIPVNDVKRIRLKIEQYALDPISLVQNVVKLQNREGYRLRIGDWRVIFADDGTVIDIIAIGPRGGVYEQE